MVAAAAADVLVGVEQLVGDGVGRTVEVGQARHLVGVGVGVGFRVGVRVDFRVRVRVRVRVKIRVRVRVRVNWSRQVVLGTGVMRGLEGAEASGVDVGDEVGEPVVRRRNREPMPG